MRLYMAAPTDYARHVVEQGFVGEPRRLLKVDPKQALAEAGFDPNLNVFDPGSEELARRTEFLKTLPHEVVEVLYFRDMLPKGLTFSRTTESAFDEETGIIHIGGGPVLDDDLSDFILSIEVPDDFAKEREVYEDPPLGWPFREFQLTEDEANRFGDTLKVFDSGDGEEVRPDLVGR